MADWPRLEADLVVEELRALAPHEQVEIIGALDHAPTILDAIKAVMCACLLDDDELALAGELAGLDRHLAHIRVQCEVHEYREMRNDR
jgi:hypothetical protein